jgi:hypothetical protein
MLDSQGKDGRDLAQPADGGACMSSTGLSSASILANPQYNWSKRRKAIAIFVNEMLYNTWSLAVMRIPWPCLM